MKRETIKKFIGVVFVCVVWFAAGLIVGADLQDGIRDRRAEAKRDAEPATPVASTPNAVVAYANNYTNASSVSGINFTVTGVGYIWSSGGSFYMSSAGGPTDAVFDPDTHLNLFTRSVYDMKGELVASIEYERSDDGTVKVRGYQLGDRTQDCRAELFSEFYGSQISALERLFDIIERQSTATEAKPAPDRPGGGSHGSQRDRIGLNQN